MYSMFFVCGSMRLCVYMHAVCARACARVCVCVYMCVCVCLCVPVEAFRSVGYDIICTGRTFESKVSSL